MKTVIAFAGRKGHGKDYCAHIAKDLMFEDSERVSFADPIKDLGASVFGWDGRKDKKGRKFLQLLGSEIGRCYNNRMWLDKALSKISGSAKNVVFNTDLRFSLEVDGLWELKDRGYKVIFVLVQKKDKFQWLTDLKWKVRCMLGLEHSSERGLPLETFDYAIENDFQAPEKAIEGVRNMLLEIGIDDLRGKVV